MSCENNINKILPQHNTSLLTDNNLETCEHTATGFNQVYYFIKNTYRRPIITVTGNFTCSPADGMFVTVFLQCQGGATCQDMLTSIPLADYAITIADLTPCHFICNVKWMNIVGVLVNLPSSNVSVCEINI